VFTFIKVYNIIKNIYKYVKKTARAAGREIPAALGVGDMRSGFTGCLFLRRNGLSQSGESGPIMVSPLSWAIGIPLATLAWRPVPHSARMAVASPLRIS
jgi:hypothetical protein